MDHQRSGAAALFDQVLWEVPGHVLPWLSPADKASFGSASWSTLEAVLQDRDATLRVDRGGSLLASLAARVRTGGLRVRATLECCGVGVAGARSPDVLNAALADIAAPPPEGHTRLSMEWWHFMLRLIQSTDADTPLLTGLVLRSLALSGTEDAEMTVLQHVLRYRAVRDTLRCLRLRREWDEAQLAETLRGLKALRHLELVDPACYCDDDEDLRGVELVRALRTCPGLRRLDLSGAHFGSEGTRLFGEWLLGAAELRVLTIRTCSFSLNPQHDPIPCRLPPSLEVFEATESTLPWVDNWDEVTNLRKLVIRHVEAPQTPDPSGEYVDWFFESDARRLASAIQGSQVLQHLELTTGETASFHYDGAGTCALLAAAAECRSLEVLDLRVRRYGRSVAELTSALVGLLRRCKRVREVSLHNAGQCPFDFAAVAAALQESGVRKLVLDECRVDDDGAAALAGVLLERGLECLSITTFCQCSGLTAVGASHLATQLARTSLLRELDMSGNRIGCDGVAALAAALPRSGVRKLGLRDCAIGGVGARCLAAVLNHTLLREVDLCSNTFGDEGAKALAVAIADSATLVSLDLSCCDITGAGGMALSEALREAATVETLDLRENKFNDADVRAMRHMHSGNSDRILLADR
ncbi:unnamed protein product [Pedinophyceae sp. YPF-701]|nr:unnamed protein product [Pedinophyceae sp. YPF-701]